MNIIIVGPDGSGKTILSKFLAEDYFDMDYHKCTFRENDKLNLAKELMKKEFTIFDRFYYPDHIVFQQVHKQPISKEELGMWNDLESDLLNNRFIVIYFSAPDDILKVRIETRGDEYITADHISDIKKYYGVFLNSTGLPLLKIETDNGIFNQRHLNEIEKFYKQAIKFYDKRKKNYLLTWGDFTGETYTHRSNSRFI